MKKPLFTILATCVCTVAGFIVACNPDNPTPVPAASQYSSTSTYYRYVGGDDTLALPNAFTPNGDGRNDYYHPVISHASLHNFSLVIYQGATSVFHMDSLSSFGTDGWDGRANHSGNTLPAGNFVARIKFITDDGQHVDDCLPIHLLTYNTAQNCLNLNGIVPTQLTFEDQFDPTTGQIAFPTGEGPACP